MYMLWCVFDLFGKKKKDCIAVKTNKQTNKQKPDIQSHTSKWSNNVKTLLEGVTYTAENHV